MSVGSRRAFCTLLGALPVLAGCEVLDILKDETSKAVDMVSEPFRSVTILSYNVRAGLGLDGVRDIARAAEVIRRAGADVVALQEIDRGTKRSGGVDQLAELERLTGQHGIWCKTIDYDGGEYGIALLSRDAPIGVRRVALPGGGEPRMLLVAEFRDYFVGATHLPLAEKDRLACVPEIRKMLSDAKPLFLAGDWNDVPGSPFVKQMRGPFALVSGVEPTFPADKPARCIDFVAVSRRHRARFEHVTHEVLPETVVSDHRPVLVKLR